MVLSGLDNATARESVPDTTIYFDHAATTPPDPAVIERASR